MHPAAADPDERLVDAARNGDLDAFNLLVDRYQNAVFTLCNRMLGDFGAAEDATQETFLSAYRALDRFQGGSVRSWLFRIAANESKDELRRRRRKDVAVSLDAVRDPEDAPLDVADARAGSEELLLQRELGASLERLLVQLSADQRQVVVLVDVYGFAYEEVAEMTASSLGTVKSRLHRGRERLRGLVLADPELSAAAHRLGEWR
jgi:RNA polymerase sigma-70 factor (ECF subfamily)